MKEDDFNILREKDLKKALKEYSNYCDKLSEKENISMEEYHEFSHKYSNIHNLMYQILYK